MILMVSEAEQGCEAGMRKRRVAIVYTNALFAQGIACLLGVEPRLQVVSVPAQECGAAEELRRLRPHVLIVERNGGGPALGAVPMELLSGVRSALLIVLGLRDAGMELFYNRRVTMAAPDTLLQAVLESGTSKRRPAAPSRAAALP